jgi:glycosyltransferase involved in cell wall biosynthesis
MKISLITVCYNSAATIRDSLASAFSQKNVTLECIVVDGASTDGTVSILSEFERKARNGDAHLTFKWISEPDRGLYDAMNKGIRMATGDIVGILNADDVFQSDETLAHVAAAFEQERGQRTRETGRDPGCAESRDRESEPLEPSVDVVYADIRFVKGGWCVDELRTAKTVRYCSAKHFRPWMFRFAVMVPHPSFYCRRELFDKYGAYSLDYRICADFELVLRYLWKYRLRTRYLDECVVTMRLGGASTASLASTIRINQEDLKALKANGCWSALWLIYLKYLFKIWGFVFKGNHVPPQ